MSGGGTKKSLRKTLGALKDTTTATVAKINSHYKELDIAIVKATNHVEQPANEKQIKAVFAAILATRHRDDVAYCIHALERRLSKTHNWAVALKTLILIHRALREVDLTFHEELINYGQSRSYMLNMTHFKDDSSPNAWDYSGWVRSYALYLEERLECFRILKYDVETYYTRSKELDTLELLEQLPALQQLLHCVIGCQPQGAAMHNHVIQSALSMVALESIKIYNAISDGTATLVDKFFEMKRQNALRALDIYRKAGQQAEKLSEFYEICKKLDVGRGEKFITIERPPTLFLQTMEECVKEAPRPSTFLKDSQAVDNKSKVILATDYKKKPEVTEARSPPLPPPKLVPEPNAKDIKTKSLVAEPPNLLSQKDPAPAVTKLDEKNAVALAIVPPDSADQTANGRNPANGATAWELALAEAPSSIESVATASKLARGLDKLTLDSLYDDAITRRNQSLSYYNPWEPSQKAALVMPQPEHHPFYASSLAASTPPSVQTAAVANQQHAFAFQQQQQMMMMTTMTSPQLQHATNPFCGSAINSCGPGMPVQTCNNPYRGLI
ncbi:PREDICTED: putative clathrin assembly protein At5g35200 isoform X1 [Ipomoea nil]|uniref:putative clathrin assembly protein At5g35200 isoform X1 n=2 Tax=Ipomoea nil TaxID=35883 RepID=UPI0009015180|nr:PREDICTED: putative clathrin assembly protein At5g35200 isoform X1 [Ipomoea nil]XP_019183886.1 PREDICTED: putative clathrin assembly protein At5g35200 isoform X1 [Ipomoea nil]